MDERVLSTGKSESKNPVCAGDYGVVLIALCGCFVISYSPVSIIISFLPLYIEDRFGIGVNGNNILFAIWPAMYAFASPFVPGVIQRYGRLSTLAMGFGLLGLSTIWFGLLFTWIELYLARTLQGVGSSFIAVSCQSILTDTFAANIGPAMGFRESYIGATFAGAPLLGGFLFEILGYKMLFVSHAGLIFLWAVVAMLMLRSKRHLISEVKIGEQAMSWGILGEFDVIVAASVVLVAYFPFGSLQPNLEEHFQQVLQLTPTAVGAFYFIQASIAIVMGPWIGALNKREDARALLLIGFNLQVIMFFFFGPTPFISFLFNSYYPMFVSQVLCMFIMGVGAVFILTSSYCLLSFVILNHPRGTPEMAASIFLFLEGLSTTISPLLTSLLMDINPATQSANCVGPCEVANPKAAAQCAATCQSSFPWTTFVICILFAAFTLFLYKVFPRIHYRVGAIEKKTDDVVEIAQIDMDAECCEL